jgi:hypothetical protein
MHMYSVFFCIYFRANFSADSLRIFALFSVTVFPII